MRLGDVEDMDRRADATGCTTIEGASCSISNCATEGAGAERKRLTVELLAALSILLFISTALALICPGEIENDALALWQLVPPV